MCRGVFPDKWERSEHGYVRDERGRKVARDSLWPSYRWFRYQTFDAVDFEDWSASRIEKLRPIESRWYRRLKRGGDVCWMYDTSESVELLSHLDDVGVCVSCGGTRSRSKCTCRKSAEGAAGRVPAAERPGPEFALMAPWADVDTLIPGGRS